MDHQRHHNMVTLQTHLRTVFTRPLRLPAIHTTEYTNGDLFGLGCQQKTRFGRHNLRVQHFQFSNNTCMACFMLPTGRQRAQPTLGIGSQRVKQKPQLIAYPLSATRPDSTKRQARTGLEET